MATVDFITALFYRVDEAMNGIPKHPQARLYPSEVVPLSLLFVLTGSGARAFYRWLERDYRPLFPQVPARTRLFRLFATHQDGADRFLAEPTIFGVADRDGVEVTPPYRTASSAGVGSPAAGARACPTTAGSSAARAAWSSPRGGWSAPGARTPPTSTTAPSTRLSPASPRA